MYDLIIVGAGPGGMTAAIYAARRKINFAIISMDIGGQMSWSSEVENYPGFEHLSGVELTREFMDHLKTYNINVIPEEVFKVGRYENKCFVQTNRNNYESKSVIVISGKSPRKLNVSGEEKLLGKGVHYCATCDAPLYKGKIAIVAGGGNSGLEAALYLANYCKRVYIVEVSDKIRGEAHLKDRVNKNRKIKIILNAEIKDVVGDSKVEGVRYSKKGKKNPLFDAPEENFFYLCDGRRLKNLIELLESLKNMSEEVYDYHVNSEKNDFSNWIRDIFFDDKLAKNIFKAKKKKKAIDLLKNKIRKSGNFIRADGLFVEVGLLTKADFIDCKKNEYGEIMIHRSTKTHEENMTNIEGIFAAGDVTDIPSKQIVIAAGEGAKAAMASFDYISKWDSEHNKK